jgi:hypothetical protein
MKYRWQVKYFDPKTDPNNDSKILVHMYSEVFDTKEKAETRSIELKQLGYIASVWDFEYVINHFVKWKG